MPNRTVSASALRRAADPRIFAGVVIMAGSAMVGLMALDAGPDDVLVAVAARDLPAGTTLQPDDVAMQQVVVQDPGRYLGQADTGGRLAVPVGKGELVPKGAIADPDHARRLVAVPVDAERLPPTVDRGTRVDVWQVESGGDDPVLSSVAVDSVTDPEQWAGATATVVLAVKENDVAGLLAAVRAGDVDVTAYEARR